MNTQSSALGWFHGRWRKVFERLDKQRIAGSVRLMAKRHPGADTDRLSKLIVRRSARLAAVAGVVSTSPALLPGIGLAISVAGIVPEEIYMMRRKCTMLLQLATLYGRDSSEEERLYEILALIGDSPRAFEALTTAKDDISRMSVRVLASTGRTVTRRANVGAKVVSRGVVRYIPVLGLLAGGGMNYYAFLLLGRRAVRFYRKLQQDGNKLPAAAETPQPKSRKRER